jgi:flagellar hook protein FlgE
MGIFDALTTAVTGLQAQSVALQNVSGNIANSQTTGYKETDTNFEDLVTAAAQSQQVAGSVTTSSQATNSVQGAIQNTSVTTDMAINGNGYFVVAQPQSSSDNQPVFSGTDLFTRRGDFEENQAGYLVNGAGYYLMGIPVDPTTGNPVGSVPQVLQFSNNFMPASATTAIDYQANLPSYPQTTDANTSVPGSELLNPADYTANPLAGAPLPAKITGTGANLSPDAAAAETGTTDLASLSATAGTLVINGTNITINAGDSASAVVNDINGEIPATGVTASLNGSNDLVLTSADASTNIDIGGASTAANLTQLGLTVGTTDATNLINQGAVAPGESLVVTVGSNAPLTVTFGTGAGQVQTLAQLSTALGSLTGGTASVNATNGDITVTAANSTDQINITGTATPSVFGIQNTTAVPANGSVVANDSSLFLSQSLAGGSVTAYDSTGAPVNMQFRWAKVASVADGGTDTWQLFYEVNSTATGDTPQWKNAGTSFTFNSNGQMSPAVANLMLNNVSVNGDSLGNVQLKFGTSGLTQFADSSGTVQVNSLQQNGFSAGQLQSIAVDSQNRVVGSFSNGQTIPLAQVTLATFPGQDNLQNLSGDAYAETAESGAPNFSASGQIEGSSLESSNVDIADQFSLLIVTQQAYSANAKVMTTADQMIQSLLAVIQ